MRRKRRIFITKAGFRQEGKEVRVQELFPQSLVACIRDGRPPYPDELASLTTKLWREAIVYWDMAARDPADLLALVALCGCGQDHGRSAATAGFSRDPKRVAGLQRTEFSTASLTSAAPMGRLP